jgi:hypothetical protein
MKFIVKRSGKKIIIKMKTPISERLCIIATPKKIKELYNQLADVLSEDSNDDA